MKGQHSGESTLQQLSVQVFRYLRTLTGDAEVARDLVQDLWLKLHEQPQAGAALVFTAARNCGLSWLRRRATRLRVLEERDGAESARVAAPAAQRPDRQLETAELRQALLEALAGLPEDQRSVFHLTEIEGLRHAEVAAILGIPQGTVASRKHHAVRRLQEELRRRGHDA